MTEARTYMDGYSDGKEWAQADILYTVEPMTAVGVDAALARLAELEKQEPVEIRYRSHYPSGPADGTRRIGDWRHIDYCTRNYGHNPVALENADAVEHLYAAAGASPVEPKEVIKEIVVHADYREMWRQQLKMNQQLNAALSAQPPAPGEAAREYMTGYSDAKEWAGATNQAQPSQAVELNDAKRLNWIRDQLFEHKWNGVVGKGCAVQWVVAPDFRFKQRELTDDSGITAGDFRRAIDAAIKAKEPK